MIVRPVDILRRPRRTADFVRREVAWMRHFKDTMELRGMQAWPPATTEATDRLHARLDASDLAQIEARLTPEEARARDAATPEDGKRLALAYGLHHGVPGIAEKTGLSPLAPPETVHAMARGTIATGGSYYYADLVADALRGAGASLEGGRGLDFGCSSGRVVRVLAAAFPEVRWHGCDPQAKPIEWAREHLPAVDFSVSPEWPPLEYDDATFDHVFAISIWSHYGERAARTWLEEMHRVIRPGGHLLLTFQGLQSIAYYVANRGSTRREGIRLIGNLYRNGHWFGLPWDLDEEGDHGIRNTEWGMAFLTTEWLLDQTLPRWSVVGYGPGRAEGNQDLAVLERR